MSKIESVFISKSLRSNNQANSDSLQELRIRLQLTVKYYLSLLLLSINNLLADETSCRYYKYCSGAAPSSSKSLPSSGSSASFNPSNIARYKGLGLEALFQAKNSVNGSIVSGTGKVGGALISPTVENSFFGNRSLELDQDFFERSEKKKRYPNKKISLALGFKVLDKRNFSLDLGISAKRNPDIKRINPGAAFSAKLYFLNFGAYFYKDDVKINLTGKNDPYSGIPYEIIHQSSTYQESFNVQTFTIGTKIKNLSLDVGTIKTKYKFFRDPTDIRIYSSAYNFKRFLLNLAYRKEESPNMDIKDGNLTPEREKIDWYYGLQYSANDNILFGIGHNTYLMDEWSATITFFI